MTVKARAIYSGTPGLRTFATDSTSSIIGPDNISTLADLDFLSFQYNSSPHVFLMSDGALFVYWVEHGGNPANWALRSAAGVWSAPTAFDSQAFFAEGGTRATQNGDTVFVAIENNTDVTIYRFHYSAGVMTMEAQATKPWIMLGLYYDSSNNLLHYWYDSAGYLGGAGKLIAYNPTTFATVYGPTTLVQQAQGIPGVGSDIDGSGANFFAISIDGTGGGPHATKVARVVASGGSYTITAETVPNCPAFGGGFVNFGSCLWDGSTLNLFAASASKLATTQRTGIDTYTAWQDLSAPSGGYNNYAGEHCPSDLGGNGDICLFYNRKQSPGTLGKVVFKLRLSGVWGAETIGEGPGSPQFITGTRHMFDLVTSQPDRLPTFGAPKLIPHSGSAISL